MNRTGLLRNTVLFGALGLTMGVFGCSCDEGNKPLARLQPELVGPAVLDFGEVPLGAPHVLPLEIKNNGELSLILCVGAPAEGQEADAHCSTLSHLEPADAPFTTDYETTTPQGGWVVDRLAGRQVLVRFTPLLEGPVEAQLILTHNGSNGPTTPITLRGVGVPPQLDVAPMVLDFGEVTVGQKKALELVLTNRTQFAQPARLGPITQVSTIFGTAFPIGEETPASQPLSIEVPGNAALTVQVWFAPVEEGQGEAVLTVSYCPTCSKDVTLLGQGVKPAIEVVPPELDFGAVDEGQSATRSFLVRNVGRSMVTLESTELEAGTTPEYVIDPAVQATLPRRLAPAEELTVGVTYTAATPGSDPGRVVVSSNAWDNPVTGENEAIRTVNLTAQTRGPDINALPPQVNFGTVAIAGAPATQGVLVENTGTSPLNISAISLNTPSSEMNVVSSPSVPSVLAPGASVTITLGYAPQAGGPDQGQLVIVSDDRDENPLVIPVVGMGGVPTTCAVSVQPAQLTFGLVERGRQASLPAEVRNTGAQPCNIQNIRLTGDAVFTSPQAGTAITVAAGSSQRIGVIYSPTAYGNNSGQLLFDSNDPTQATVTVPISGSSAPSDIRVIPGSIDFAVVPVTCGSPNRSITIYNTGSAAVNVTRIYLDPSTSTEFELCATGAPTSGRCPSTLAVPTRIPAGASVSFNVRYRPRDIGSDTGLLFIEHSASTVPVAVPLSGQGDVTPTVTDRFTQLPTPQADVLFVVDNSCSMDEEQASLGSNLGAFLTNARTQSIDYHVSVTTTDVDGGEDGRFVGSTRILTPSTPNQDALFRTMVTQGTSGSSDEKGLEAAYLALTDPNLSGANAGFLRTDAALAIILVSDEEDSSPRPVSFYQNFFSSLKAPPSTAQFSFSSVVTPPGGCMTGSTEGTRYIAVSQATGGVMESICTSNWGTALANIGLATFGLRSRFSLSSQPVPSTIAVSVNGTPVQGVTPAGQTQWLYEGSGNAVVFQARAVPSANAAIEITYTVACLP